LLPLDEVSPSLAELRGVALDAAQQRSRDAEHRCMALQHRMEVASSRHAGDIAELRG